MSQNVTGSEAAFEVEREALAQFEKAISYSALQHYSYDGTADRLRLVEAADERADRARAVVLQHLTRAQRAEAERDAALGDVARQQEEDSREFVRLKARCIELGEKIVRLMDDRDSLRETIKRIASLGHAALASTSAPLPDGGGEG